MSLLINDTKYFTLLSTLNEKDKTALIEFSSLESFNPSKKIHFLIYHSSKVNPITNKIELYHILFSNTNYDDRKLRNLLSRTYLFVQRFIAIRYFEQNQNQFFDISYKALQIKKVDRFTDEKLNQWKKNIKQDNILDDQFINKKMDFYDEEFHRTLKHSSNSNRNFKISNLNYNEALDEYFILKKIKLFITSFNYQSFVNLDGKFTLLEEVISFVKNKKSRSLVLDIYFNLLMMHYDDTKDDYYYNLKTNFSEINKRFNEDEKREIYLLIQNFIIKKINRGNSEFLNELFRLFKTMLANNTILEKEKLSQWSYKNIVTVALRLKEFDWCELFIEDYKYKLNKEFRLESYSFALANFFYSKKEYENALPLLLNINYKDFLSIISAKILQLKIFYELKELDTLISNIENFDKILTRKKSLSKENIIRYKNFNKYLKRILKLKSKREKDKLFRKLEGQKSVHSKTWLLKKIANL